MSSRNADTNNNKKIVLHEEPFNKTVGGDIVIEPNSSRIW
jgi:hypothetical protein